MAEQRRGKFCRLCGKQTLAVRPGTNHVLHLLLSIVTLGIWLPVWLGLSIKFGGWKCSQCGSRV